MNMRPISSKLFETGKDKQRRSLQAMLIQLVDVVQDKMKGFSPTETKDYYTDITRRAWLAVEGAQTPEIKSAQFDHTLEWTMLDDQFNNRTANLREHTSVYSALVAPLQSRIFCQPCCWRVFRSCQPRGIGFRW